MQPESELLPDRFTVYLVRHATPDRSQYDIPYHTPPGPGLTDNGRVEAYHLGEFLRGAGVAHILASPLQRAWLTGEVIAAELGIPLDVSVDLAEWRLDELEPPVLARMRRVFEFAARRSAEVGPLALITHGAPVLALLKWLGLPPAIVERSRIYDSRNLVPMAGAWQVEREGARLHMRLAYVPDGKPVPNDAVSDSLAFL